MDLLEGKVALVTGGARGLGAAIVHRFAAAGATGLVFDRLERMTDLPPRWRHMRGDVTEEADLAKAVDAIGREFGRLDIVVANAGIVPPWRESAAIDLVEWDRVFAVNVRGVIAAVKHGLPLMKAHGGAVVIMGSSNSTRGHPGQALYAATKHAVIGVTRSAALDLGRFGIRVNALAPGPVATDALLRRIGDRAAGGGPGVEDVLARYASETALGRLASADEVADAALFLAGPLAGGITGQVIPVDAGLY
ncbi:MAG: SDR family oxidoreductase [Alphaproteobacteria bacterium]|nr:SDR family oxidoreductase [Alphaproteobacteria bacterium]